jgi:hypothetical protein
LSAIFIFSEFNVFVLCVKFLRKADACYGIPARMESRFIHKPPRRRCHSCKPGQSTGSRAASGAGTGSWLRGAAKPGPAAKVGIGAIVRIGGEHISAGELQRERGKGNQKSFHVISQEWDSQGIAVFADFESELILLDLLI